MILFGWASNCSAGLPLYSVLLGYLLQKSMPANISPVALPRRLTVVPTNQFDSSNNLSRTPSLASFSTHLLANGM